jgi:hypothetical protein
LFYSFSYTYLLVNPESEMLTYDADYSFLGIKYKSRLSVYILTLKSIINTPYETRSKELVLPTSFLDYYIKLSSMIQDMYGKLGSTSIILKITYQNGNKIDTSLLVLGDGIYSTTLRDMFKSQTKKVSVKTNVKDNETLIRMMSWINSEKYKEFENLLTSLMNFLNNYI